MGSNFGLKQPPVSIWTSEWGKKAISEFEPRYEREPASCLVFPGYYEN